MHPVLAKTLSKAHCKAEISVGLTIDFDARRIDAVQSERISCEFRRVCDMEGEALVIALSSISNAALRCDIRDRLDGTGKFPPDETLAVHIYSN